MKALVWFLYEDEIPRNTETYINTLSLDHFARQHDIETIRSFNLLPGQTPVQTGNTYTVWTRFGVFDRPVKVFSRYKGRFEDIYDVLNHARRRNDAMIIVGADGASCVRDSICASRMIFPQIFIWQDAIHFDYETPSERKFLSTQAKEISLMDAVTIMGGFYG